MLLTLSTVRSRRHSYHSQAESAGSIPVTRSTGSGAVALHPQHAGQRRRTRLVVRDRVVSSSSGPHAGDVVLDEGTGRGRLVKERDVHAVVDGALGRVGEHAPCDPRPGTRLARLLAHVDPRANEPHGAARLGRDVDDRLRDWVASRGDLAESTRALYRRLLSTWIDAPLSVERPTGRAMAVHLGAQTLASVTPADVREWDSTVLTESTRRAVERWERARSHPRQVNAAIRRWAVQNEISVAQTGRIPAAVRGAWLAATGDPPAEDRTRERNAGRTEAAQAYRLLHTGMTQAVADGMIPTNPCLVKGASQR